MPNYDRNEDFDASRVSHQGVTRRPLSRPQSARVNRYVDAIHYGAALQQIAVDQAASLEQARQFRESISGSTRQSQRLQAELKAMQVEVSKEKQNHLLENKAEKYYAAEIRRSQDQKAKAKANYEDHVAALGGKNDEREFNADLKKRRLRMSERYWAAMESQRHADTHFGASSHREQLLDNIRQRIEQAAKKKAEYMENFHAAEDRRKDQQFVSGISKEIQRTQGRIAQLQLDQHAWQTACRDREITHPELIIEEKLRDAAKRLAGLDSELKSTLTEQSKRQRPRSAMTFRPQTSGITAFSSDTPRRSVGMDASVLGPRITVVDPRI